MQKGCSKREAAKVLGKSPNTVCLEVKKNSVGGEYNPKKAHEKARQRRKQAQYQGMRIVECPPLRAYVDGHLYDGHSPEMISGRLRYVDTHLPYVSASAIRRYLRSVYGRKIEAYLQQQKRRKPRKDKGKKRFTNDPDKVNIHNRPPYINTRMRIGDAEADFIVSSKEYKTQILVVTDRKSRMVHLEKLPNPSCIAVHRAFVQIQKRYPALNSLSVDNDILFQKHKELATLLGVPIYFCDPYSSWQKGSVENTNKHLRKYLPKGSNLGTVPAQELRKIEKRLNGRIMKILHYRTPEEAHVLFGK